MRFWILCVFLWGCSAPNRPPSQVPHMSIELHADVEFTLYERHLIGRAVAELDKQIGMHVGVKYDLDFRDPVSLIRNKDNAVMVRVDQDNSAVAQLDEQFGSPVYAVTLPGRQIVVVWERMDRAEMYVSVIMHEFLHTQGVRHVQDKNALMFGGTNGGTLTPMQVTESDRAAIRRALGQH